MKIKGPILLVVGAICAVAVAKVGFVKDFESTYEVKKGSALAKAKCAVCHTTGAKLNTYGVDLQKAMAQENTKVLTGSVMKKVEGMDSDKDGKSNIAEIKAGTLPGDPKSK